MIIVQLDSEQLSSIIQSAVRKVISETASFEQPKETERWYDIDELCDYLPDKPRKPTVYGWVSDGKIPSHKGAKKLRFLKSEIDNWLKQGRRQTIAETEAIAQSFISQSRYAGSHQMKRRNDV